MSGPRPRRPAGRCSRERPYLEPSSYPLHRPVADQRHPQPPNPTATGSHPQSGRSPGATGCSRLKPRSVATNIRLYTYRLGLDRAAILSAGRELARQEGVEAVGVRSVAGAAGATPMALYRYVADAADLRDAVLGLIFESLPEPPRSLDDLADWARGFRGWLMDIPGLSRLVLIRWFELPPLLDVVESLLEVFAQAGLEGFELVAAANALFSYVLARGELEEAVRSAGVNRALRWGGSRTSRPLLRSLRREYEVARLEDHFDFGLELLLRGLLGQSAESG